MLLYFKLVIYFYLFIKFPQHKIHHFKLYNSVTYSKFTGICNHHQYLIPKETPYPLSRLIFTPSLQPLTTTNLLFLSMDQPILDISYKWNHTTYGFLCLASFAQHVSSRFLHVQHVSEIILFLWPNNIPYLIFEVIFPKTFLSTRLLSIMERNEIKGAFQKTDTVSIHPDFKHPFRLKSRNCSVRQVARMVKNQITLFTLKNFNNLQIIFCFYQFVKCTKFFFLIKTDVEPARSRTQNLLIRSQTRYPLRHWPRFDSRFSISLCSLEWLRKQLLDDEDGNQLDRKELWIVVKLIGYIQGHFAWYIHLKYL